MSRLEAENAASQLLNKYGIDRLPVPVEEIAMWEGAQVVRQRFEGEQSGFMYREGRERIIGINTSSGRRRQRFTIAHEIGHMTLHLQDPLVVDREVNWRDENSSLAVDPKEIDANAFAAALLMPQDLVVREVRLAAQRSDLSGRDRIISYLAQIFDVSTSAMSYRLINLGIYS
ncbi:ImmA/IrrE family metallo-endopeptidase [Catellatospora bangladeshensis]|uniref:IrrE N-terminal-like domain-containing protein n=1 Tax=Catellatospora bangladeshensis TaxID=310355 RepID=A0A8J3JAV9_9ACTN|nr:ImmA/IrrE family metallo-endopeptidase [Catellatospora bangladeshensis]GIF80856.1 hypothetical protein Cba03nite_22050 [Catellatospora bangladeshensis]